MRRAASAALLALVFIFGFLEITATPVSAQESMDLKGQVCSHDEDRYYIQAPDHEECLGGPLPDALVTLTDPDGTAAVLPSESSTTTDASGTFYFEDLGAGDYTLRVERDGFEPVERDIEVPREERLVVNLDGLRVTAQGTVEDADGPVAGADVTFFQRDRAHTETGDDGTYDVTLTAGYYNIEIRHPDHRAFYDWRLVDGTETFTHTLQKAPDRDATLTGTVTDQDGEPIADAFVDIHQYGGCCYDEPRPMPASASGDAEESGSASPPPQEDAIYPYYEDGYQQVRTDASGTFTAQVYSGWVDLSIWKDGYARIHDGFEMEAGGDDQREYTMEKFPDKTAHITGRIVDASTGDGIQYASLSIENPRYGTYACSRPDGSGSGGSDGEADAMSDEGMTMVSRPYYEPSCDITIQPDGRFEGSVTPGYSILRVYHDHWRSCHETTHGDGSMTRDCGPQYYSYSLVEDLEADATTELTIRLVARPAPDATLSGYAVDTETDQAVPDVHVSFSNQATYGWASAETDGDGSYKVRLHSGYIQVHVWADGYFPWEGVIQVPEDSDVSLDIPLTPGRSQYGGCCYAYAEADGARGADTAETVASPGAAPGGPSNTAPPADRADTGSDQDQAFMDLGGGLGPYNAAERGEPGTAEVESTPSVGLLVIGLAALVMAGLRRRAA